MVKLYIFEILFVLFMLLSLTFNVVFYNIDYLRFIFVVIAIFSLFIISINSKFSFNKFTQNQLYLFFLTTFLLLIVLRDLIHFKSISEIHVFLSMIFAIFLSKYPKYLFHTLSIGLIMSTIAMIFEGLILKEYIYW